MVVVRSVRPLLHVRRVSVVVGWLVCLVALWALPAWGQMPSFFRQPKGSLLIVGGGDTPLQVVQRFVALAGGAEKARIAVLPMASAQGDEEAQEMVADFQRLGVSAQVVDIGPQDADADSTVARLEAFTGYWFSGGDQTRLSSMLVGSRALQVIETRYQNGAVVGGTSAGASVMSSLMLTGNWRPPEQCRRAGADQHCTRHEGAGPRVWLLQGRHRGPALHAPGPLQPPAQCGA